MKYIQQTLNNKICYAPRYEYYHPFLTVLEDFLNNFGFTEIVFKNIKNAYPCCIGIGGYGPP